MLYRQTRLKGLYSISPDITSPFAMQSASRLVPITLSSATKNCTPRAEWETIEVRGFQASKAIGLAHELAAVSRPERL
jgi:hypothetical protein